MAVPPIAAPVVWLLTCVLSAASAGAVRSPSLHSQFPGTGDLKDDGVDKGKYYAVNFPLNDGIDDKTYLSVFKPVCLPPLASPLPLACALGAVAGCSVADESGLTTVRFWLCLLSFNPRPLSIGDSEDHGRVPTRCRGAAVRCGQLDRRPTWLLQPHGERPRRSGQVCKVVRPAHARAGRRGIQHPKRLAVSAPALARSLARVCRNRCGRGGVVFAWSDATLTVAPRSVCPLGDACTAAAGPTRPPFCSTRPSTPTSRTTISSSTTVRSTSCT